MNKKNQNKKQKKKLRDLNCVSSPSVQTNLTYSLNPSKNIACLTFTFDESESTDNSKLVKKKLYFIKDQIFEQIDDNELSYCYTAESDSTISKFFESLKNTVLKNELCIDSNYSNKSVNDKEENYDQDDDLKFDGLELIEDLDENDIKIFECLDDSDVIKNLNQKFDSFSLKNFQLNSQINELKNLINERKNDNDKKLIKEDSLLSLACNTGYYELAQFLITSKADIEDRSLKDLTPLMESSIMGHVNIVQLLLNYGAKVDAKTNQGNTALIYAAAHGHVEVCRALLDHIINNNIIDKKIFIEMYNDNGHTALMEAASSGHVKVAQFLIEEHNSSIYSLTNEYKESVLTLASYKGHLEMVKYLLDLKKLKNKEFKIEELNTALMEASMDGHVEVARLLIESGANVNMSDDSFESPLTLAACGGHVELALLLLQKGANIEEINDEGYTPLMEAAREGHEEMVALLLTEGADINAITEETHETALTLACCGGFLEVADFLIRAGADIELGANTPLMESAQEGHLDLCKLLIENGANVNARSANGDSALMLASENDHYEVVKFLILNNADLEIKAEGGRTALMKAARAGRLNSVKVLVEHGAIINKATTNRDHTALSLACFVGHKDVVSFLLSKYAKLKYRLKDNSTILIEATKGGHTQIAKKLLEYVYCHEQLNNHFIFDDDEENEDNSKNNSAFEKKVLNNDPLNNNLKEDNSTNIPTIKDKNFLNSIQEFDQQQINIKKNIFNTSFSKIDNSESQFFAESFKEICELLPKSDKIIFNNIKQNDSTCCSEENNFDRFIKLVNEIMSKLYFRNNPSRKIIEIALLEKSINEMIERTKLLNPTKEEEFKQKQRVLDELHCVEKEFQQKFQTPFNSKKQREIFLRSFFDFSNEILLGLNTRGSNFDPILHQKALSKFMSDNSRSNCQLDNKINSATDHPQSNDSNLFYSKFEFDSDKEVSLDEEELNDSKSLNGEKLEVLDNKFVEKLILDNEKDKNIIEDDHFSKELELKNLLSTFSKNQDNLFFFEKFSQIVHNLFDNKNNLKVEYESNNEESFNEISSEIKLDDFNDESFINEIYYDDDFNNINENYKILSEIIDKETSFSKMESSRIEEDDHSNLYSLFLKNLIDQFKSTVYKKSVYSSNDQENHTEDKNIKESFKDKNKENSRNDHNQSFNNNPNKDEKKDESDGNDDKDNKKDDLNDSFEEKDEEQEDEDEEEESKELNDLLNEEFLNLHKNYDNSKFEEQDNQKICENNCEDELENNPTSNKILEENSSKIFSEESNLNDTSCLCNRSTQTKNESYSSESSHNNNISNNSNEVIYWTNDQVIKYFKVKKNKKLKHSDDASTQTIFYDDTKDSDIKIAAQKLKIFDNSLFSEAFWRKNIEELSEYKFDDNTIKFATERINKLFNQDPNDVENKNFIKDWICEKSKDPSLLKDLHVFAKITKSIASTNTNDQKSYNLFQLINNAVQESCLFENNNLSDANESSIEGTDSECSKYQNKEHGIPKKDKENFENSENKNFEKELNNSKRSRVNFSKNEDKKMSSREYSSSLSNSNFFEIQLSDQEYLENETERLINYYLSEAYKNKEGSIFLNNTDDFEFESIGYEQEKFVNSQTDSNHDTALSLACANGHYELVKVLLKGGANIELRDKKGFTPLMLAASVGHYDVCELLLNSKADIEAQIDRTKDTALTLACASGRYEVVELLLSRGANKEHRIFSDYTPLNIAGCGGYEKIVKLLLDRGAEIDSKTGSRLNISALMLASMNGHYNCVKLLLDMGSDVNAQIETNKSTALTLASYQGRSKVVSLLLERNANIEHRAKAGLTPLMVSSNSQKQVPSNVVNERDVSSIKNSNANKTSKKVDKDQFFEDNLNKSNSDNKESSQSLASSNDVSPDKVKFSSSIKKEDDWKEVVRRQKKISVPQVAVSRVIGRAGCNIKLIREVSGAHIDIENQKNQSDRQIIIKGYNESTKIAHQLIQALVDEPEKNLSQALENLGLVNKEGSINKTNDFCDSTLKTKENVNEACSSQTWKIKNNHSKNLVSCNKNGNNSFMNDSKDNSFTNNISMSKTDTSTSELSFTQKVDTGSFLSISNTAGKSSQENIWCYNNKEIKPNFASVAASGLPINNSSNKNTSSLKKSNEIQIEVPKTPNFKANSFVSSTTGNSNYQFNNQIPKNFNFSNDSSKNQCFSNNYGVIGAKSAPCTPPLSVNTINSSSNNIKSSLSQYCILQNNSHSNLINSSSSLNSNANAVSPKINPTSIQKIITSPNKLNNSSNKLNNSPSKLNISLSKSSNSSSKTINPNVANINEKNIFNINQQPTNISSSFKIPYHQAKPYNNSFLSNKSSFQNSQDISSGLVNSAVDPVSVTGLPSNNFSMSSANNTLFNSAVVQQTTSNYQNINQPQSFLPMQQPLASNLQLQMRAALLAAGAQLQAAARYQQNNCYVPQQNISSNSDLINQNNKKTGFLPNIQHQQPYPSFLRQQQQNQYHQARSPNQELKNIPLTFTSSQILPQNVTGFPNLNLTNQNKVAVHESFAQNLKHLSSSNKLLSTSSNSSSSFNQPNQPITQTNSNEEKRVPRPIGTERAQRKIPSSNAINTSLINFNENSAERNIYNQWSTDSNDSDWPNNNSQEPPLSNLAYDSNIFIMHSSQTKTCSMASSCGMVIPKRVKYLSESELPYNYSKTPGGTIYSTTPGDEFYAEEQKNDQSAINELVDEETDKLAKKKSKSCLDQPELFSYRSLNSPTEKEFEIKFDNMSLDPIINNQQVQLKNEDCAINELIEGRMDLQSDSFNSESYSSSGNSSSNSPEVPDDESLDDTADKHEALLVEIRAFGGRNSLKKVGDLMNANEFLLEQNSQLRSLANVLPATTVSQKQLQNNLHTVSTTLHNQVNAMHSTAVQKPPSSNPGPTNSQPPPPPIPIGPPTMATTDLLLVIFN
ncbi:hypothetical protein RND71_043409 [Anisodus tanguticus]|uniref:WH2 domain-containing protein n=1 Tax=Anisodus tanguticus TaxID=243964 RepID=A0AAE1QNE1_9SOLA|nr:hypothetical protein RND71_043409 [Anisodus tanguticus]